MKPQHYWKSPYNKHLAIEAIDAISKSCKEHNSSCWGVGLLNEYERDKDETDLEGMLHGLFSKGDNIIIQYLDGYYEDAIKKARETLDLDVPVVLFSWDYDLP